jgi:adenine-specific DNA-methyltransferase
VTDAAQRARRKRFDKIDVKLDDGVLRVEGVQRVSERAEGLGGEFTYCTLGDPLSVEQLLSGERLPPLEALGAWLFHTATGGTLPPRPADAPRSTWARRPTAHVWLIYQPDLAFLKSPEAALTLTRAGVLQAWGRDFDAAQRQRAPQAPPGVRAGQVPEQQAAARLRHRLCAAAICAVP